MLRLWQALTVGSFVATIWLLRFYRSAVPVGKTDLAPLSFGEKACCALLAFFNPIIAGAILSIGWRRPCPRKAFQAMAIASGVLFLQILSLAAAFFLFARYGSFS